MSYRKIQFIYKNIKIAISIILVNVEIENPLIKSFLFLKIEKIKRGKGIINNIPNITETMSLVIKKYAIEQFK
mgnify:CR=1 FL=1